MVTGAMTRLSWLNMPRRSAYRACTNGADVRTFGVTARSSTAGREDTTFLTFFSNNTKYNASTCTQARNTWVFRRRNSEISRFGLSNKRWVETTVLQTIQQHNEDSWDSGTLSAIRARESNQMTRGHRGELA